MTNSIRRQDRTALRRRIFKTLAEYLEKDLFQEAGYLMEEVQGQRMSHDEAEEIVREFIEELRVRSRGASISFLYPKRRT